MTSAMFLSAVHVCPESQKVVRPDGSQRGSQIAMVLPSGSDGTDLSHAEQGTKGSGPAVDCRAQSPAWTKRRTSATAHPGG